MDALATLELIRKMADRAIAQHKLAKGNAVKEVEERQLKLFDPDPGSRKQEPPTGGPSR